jgi:ribosome-associated translation inhibitor RaiA
MDTEKTYEEITGYIRNISPLLENPEELAQTIMTRIERISKHNRKRKIMLITGLISGVAACLLLCLLVYESIQLSSYQAAGTEISMRQRIKSDHLNISDTMQIHTSDKIKSGKTNIVEIIGENRKRNDRKQRIYSRYSYKLSSLSK